MPWAELALALVAPTDAFALGHPPASANAVPPPAMVSINAVIVNMTNIFVLDIPFLHLGLDFRYLTPNL